MASLESSIVSLFLLLFAAAAFYQAIQSYTHSRQIATVLSKTTSQAGESGAVQGTVNVSEPVTVRHSPPEEAAHEFVRPAVVAWRIRRKISRSGKRNRSQWKTVDGGIETGEFTIQQNGRYVRIPRDMLSTDHDNVVDPFDVSTYHFGDPQIDIRLGEPDLLTNFLERIRLIGDDGLLKDVEVSLRIGRQSLAPDKYQASYISDGDEIAIEGEVVDAKPDPMLQTSEKPTIIAGNNIQGRSKRLRYRALSQVGLGVLAIGGAHVFSNLL